MVNVIEVNATDGKIAKLLERRSRFDVSEHGCLRFKSKRNESGKAPCFILQFAQLPQVVDPLWQRLNVSIEHRASAAATHIVPGPMNIQPFRGAFFAVTNLITHRRIENFGPAPSHGIETRLAQRVERIANRHAEDALR